MELGHPQPPTPIHVDNTTAVGIINHTIKRQRSRAMEIRCFWLLDQKNIRYIRVWYKPGAENMGDYPRALLRADNPSSLRGCVELLGSPYYKGVPLSRIPSARKPGMKSHIAQQTEYPSVGTHEQFRRSVGVAQLATAIRRTRNRTIAAIAQRSQLMTSRSNCQLDRAVGPVGPTRSSTRRST